MRCPQCGELAAAGAAFCHNCGRRLADVSGASGDPNARAEPVPIREQPGVLHSGDIAVRSEGQLVPAVDVHLGGKEGIYFEHHVLLWKDPRVRIGLKPLRGAVKRMFAGLQVFVTEAKGPGSIAFSRDAPGQIVALRLEPGEEIHVREHQFILATDGVAYDFFRVRGVANIFFGGTGFFIDRFTGSGGAGLVLVHGYGNVFTRILDAGEQIDIEPGAFLWKDESVSLETNVTNLSTGLFGGTSFMLNRFTGPGRLGIQSMMPFPPTNDDTSSRSHQRSP